MKDKRRNGLSFFEILVMIALAVIASFFLHHRFGSFDLPARLTDGALAMESPKTEAWDRDSLYKTLQGAFEALEEEIVLPYDCSDELFDVYKEVLADHPELFWLSGGGTFVKKTSGTDVTVEPDRRAAIHLALARAAPGDTVVVCGKGHETTQTIGTRVLPFDDRIVCAEY